MSTGSIFKKNNLTMGYMKPTEQWRDNLALGSNSNSSYTGKPVLTVYNNYNQDHYTYKPVSEPLYSIDETQESAKSFKTKYNSPIRVNQKITTHSLANTSTLNTPKQQLVSKKLSTPGSLRKYSDNCDSNDETKSISSIKTKDSFYSKTPGDNAKKSNDFKVKYKTEICKYWDINKFCRFGDNVKFKI
jgi:hypothetical protein